MFHSSGVRLVPTNVKRVQLLASLLVTQLINCQHKLDNQVIQEHTGMHEHPVNMWTLAEHITTYMYIYTCHGPSYYDISSWDVLCAL